MLCLTWRFLVVQATMIVSLGYLTAITEAADKELSVVFRESFEKGAKNWQPTDPEAWKIESTDDGQIYHQFKKNSNYKPPHRSPLNIALLKDVIVGDFELTAKVRSTHPDYGHRDVCLFFGYQDPAHFYYVHLGKRADDHANQIFIVNEKPRTKISLKSTPGTNWDDRWHHVKIVRTVDRGTIEIFFDDMKKPVMKALDKSFQWGQVGIGSFDDTSAWDDIELRGVKLSRPKK